ncbi:MAG: hypothetical protein LBE11_03360 [Prevotellaceae bacterium]|jgi:hypothetical protein|nr:hypothetical protein [Prevotellaceae bacterium]
MQNFSHKILSFILCVAYILASWGFVRHICNNNDKNISYVSLLVNDECNYCLENKNTEEQCCHQHAKQTQSEDEDCCEKTIQKISNDQNCSQYNGASGSVFFAITAAILHYSASNLTCDRLSKSATTYTPLINSKIPLIYFTGQLRL